MYSSAHEGAVEVVNSFYVNKCYFKPWADYHALMKIFYFFKLLETIQTNKIEPGHFSTKTKCFMYTVWNQPKIASINYIFPLGHIYMIQYIHSNEIL